MHNKQKTITFFHRKPRPGNFSIETLFKELRHEISKNYECKYHEAKYYSNGLIKRFLITIDFAFNQGDINHMTGDINFANLFFKKDKTISTILDINRLKEISSIKKMIYFYFWIKIPIIKSKYVVTISHTAKREILKYTNCNPDKIKVIYVQSKSIFKKSEKAFNEIKPVILQVGTKQNKNLIRLIEAIKDINCELHIVGILTKSQLEALKDNKIDYRNFVNLSEVEIYERYVACDILAFVSIREGFGMPIVEANSVGRPVLTSNVSSMPEVASDAAILVDPYNINDIKKGFHKIINNENFRNELIKKGFINSKRFKIDKIVSQYVQLYKTL